jgi:hypothetical protein
MKNEQPSLNGNFKLFYLKMENGLLLSSSSPLMDVITGGAYSLTLLN